MRRVKNAIIIVPRAGSGQHVFRPEARRFQALYGVPDSHVIVFDNNASPRERFRYVCERIERIVGALPPGEVIDSVIVLCHGWKTGDQIGATNQNLFVFFGSFKNRLSASVVVAFCSCSNGADTSVGPGGDGSFADTARDVLCGLGFVYCRTTGHLAPGHATRYPIVRFFDGDGSRTGGAGGYGVVPTGDPLFPTWRAELRKAVDPDGPGPEPMTSLRWTYPWMTVQEIRDRLTKTDQLVRTTGRTEPPTTDELQAALARGGYMALPTAGHGLGLYGPITTAAVRAFQQSVGLKVDGDAGPDTWAALRAAGLIDTPEA